MHRYLLGVLVVLALVTAAACGGGSKAAPSATVSAGAGSATATPTDVSLAQPTPPQPGEPIIQVKYGKNSYTPTRAEVEALPTTSITIKGKDYKGVTLAEIAAKVSASASTQATILGTNSLGTRIGGALLSTKSDGTSAVFIISTDGYLRFAATSVDASRWLVDITSIVFQ